MEKIHKQDQNLISQLPREEVARPRGFYQSIVLETLMVVAALGFGYAAYLQVVHGGVIPWVVGALALFSLLAVFHSLFVPASWQRRAAVFSLATAASVVFFFRAPPGAIATVSAAMFFSLLWGDSASRRRVENSVELRLTYVSKHYLRRIVTAALVLLIVFSLSFDGSRLIFSEQSFRVFSRGVQRVVQAVDPEIDINAPIEEAVADATRSQLSKIEEFTALSSAQQETEVERVSASVSQRLSDQFGISVEPDKPVSDALYSFLSAKIVDWQERFGIWFLVVWGVSLFFILRGVGEIFIWLLLLIIGILYHLGLATSIIRARGISTVREVVEFGR